MPPEPTPRSPARSPRRLRLAAAALLPIVAVVLWIDPCDSAIDPRWTSPERAAAIIAAADPDEQWQLVFDYGHVAGTECDLDEVRRRGDALPEALQFHFYDGVGHGEGWAGREPREALADIDRALPAQHRLLAYDGVLRTYTLDHARDPDAVLAVAARIQEIEPGYDPRNGVRIGVQQALGDDLDEALAVAARYPEEYGPPMFEELGWRAGYDHADDPAEVARLSAGVADELRCTFESGAARGSVREVWTDGAGWRSTAALIQGLSPECRREQYAGVARMLEILVGHAPERIELAVGAVDDPAQAAALRDALGHLDEPGHDIW